jgi:hypothetical protein
MKRLWFLLLVMVFAFSFSGCVTVRKVVRERVDQDVDGNQGYLMGSSDTSPKARTVDREYLDIRIEVPTWEEITAPAVRHEDDSLAKIDTPSASKSNISTRTKQDPKKAYTPKKQPPKTTTVYEYDAYEVDIYDDYGDAFVYEEIEVKPAYQEYTVKQGETLSHIAKAFYGKASKWTIIYEANSDKIKDPSKVRAGTKLRIPDLKEAESKYAK